MPNATQQRRRPHVHWTHEAKVVFMQQVYHEKPYLTAYGQRGKAWESVARTLSSIPPFVASGGMKADSCSQNYGAMIKEHRDHLANTEWQSGKRYGENEDLYKLLHECMTKEQEVMDEKEKKHKESQGSQLEKEARAEKVAGLEYLEEESQVASDKEAKSSSWSSSSILESSMASYFASLTDSPETKRRRLEIDFMEAKRKLDQSDILQRVLDSKEDSPETKRRRKDAEDSDVAARRLDAEKRRLEGENRRLELQLRQDEVKASHAVQEGTLKFITKLIDKFGGET